jgi:hypothetical protein
MRSQHVLLRHLCTSRLRVEYRSPKYGRTWKATSICAAHSDCRTRFAIERVRATFTIKSDAPREKIQQILEQAQRRSAVFDIVSHGVPVSVQLAAS